MRTLVVCLLTAALAPQLLAQDAQSCFKKGLAAQLSNKLEEAVRQYDRALELDPRMVNAYVNRGTVHFRQKRISRARADFDRALELEPRRASTYNNRAVVGIARGDLQGAMRDFSRAIALDPRHAAYYYNRSSVRMLTGDIRAALADLDRSLALDPRFAEALLNRAVVRQRMGDREGAKRDLALVVRLIPEPKPKKPEPEKKGNEKKLEAELRARLDKLIGELGDKAWKVREEATKALIKIGKPAEPTLTKVLAKTQSVEVKSRLEKILAKIQAPQQAGSWSWRNRPETRASAKAALDKNTAIKPAPQALMVEGLQKK